MNLAGIFIAALLLVSKTSLSLVWASQPEENHDTSKKPAVIDINRASAQDFERLPRIGSELARRIVAYREKHGPFRRVEDLLIIRGIGPKKWRAIRPYMRVGSYPGK